MRLNTGMMLMMFLPGVVLASSEITLESNLSHNLELSWSKVSKFRHSVDCYPLGKSNKYSEQAPETITKNFNKSSELGSSISYPIKSDHHGRPSLGNVDFNAVLLRTDINQQTYRVSLNDGLRFSHYHHHGNSKCVIREHHWNVSSHLIEGQMAVKYTMPKGSWIFGLKLHVRKGNVQFDKTLLGDLHSKTIVFGEVLYVWSKPGDVIRIPMSIQVASGGGEQTAFDLTVIRPNQMSAKQIADSLKGLRIKYIESGFTDEDVVSFVHAGMQIIGKTKTSLQVVNEMGLDEFTSLSDWLFQLANSDRKISNYDLDMKAIAAAIGYELALGLLEEMKVFCKDTEVQLKLSNSTVVVPGFAAAYFWINRDIMRLGRLQFPEIRAFISELVRWENNGLTYSQVVSDSNKMKAIRNGFIEIRRHSELADAIYVDLAKSLEVTMREFGSLASGSLSYEDMKRQLKGLGRLRQKLNSEFQIEVMEFNAANNYPIDASKILTLVDELESATAALSDSMLSRVKFVSGKNDRGDYLELILGQLAHQVNIFEKPLTSGFIEVIRKAVFDIRRVSELKIEYGQCIEGVGI